MQLFAQQSVCQKQIINQFPDWRVAWRVGYVNRLGTRMDTRYLAEAVRFELTEGINPRRFSRPVP